MNIILPFPAPFCTFVCLALLSALPVGAAQNAGTFPAPYNTRKEQPILKPEEAVETFQVPPGFHVSLFAGEPDVQQPIGMATDRKGRLWVCENYTYSEKPASWDTNLSDRILIFEDKDGDGHFDSRKVFWDKAKKLTSVAVGFNGVFALCPPRLIFFPDRNHDDVPDRDPEVLLDGFEDTVIWHNIANGLKFGPDGWLYGRQGIQGTSHIGAPGTPDDQRVAFNAGIWRFHPVTHKFEAVAEGTTNPWGSDWDDNGQMFFINTVIGHLWHVVPGAYYRRMYGEHLRPHLYELIDQTADHYHWDTRDSWDRIRVTGVTSTTSEAGGGHAHSGMMIYLGDNWPHKYRDTLFTINFHGKRLNNDLLERQGADYTAHHGKDLMMVGDQWFRGIDLLYGPDGGVFVSDWSDIGECHDADAINRTSGRIYKITHAENLKKWSGDIETLSNDELVRLQLHHNEWFARQARLTLQERASGGSDMRSVPEQLRRMFDTEKETPRKLRALWALYVTGRAGEPMLMRLLEAQDEQLRTWAIQLLVDGHPPSAPALMKFTHMARTEKSGLVLSMLASALQRTAVTNRWPLAEALATHSEFAEDRVFPLMLWYGIEPAVPHSTEHAVALASHAQLPKLWRFIARRIFEDLKTNAAAADRLLTLLTPNQDSKFQTQILTGMNEALKTAVHPAAPASWKEVSPRLTASTDPQVRELTLELGALFGDPRALDRFRQFLSDTNADLGTRRKALQVLLQGRAQKLSSVLFPLLNEVQLAPDAIRALAAINEPEAMKTLLERYPKLEPPEARAEAINVLATRQLSAMALLDAVQHGIIPRPDIGPAQIRQLRSLHNAELDEKINSIWPQLDESPSGKKQLYARYKEMFAPERIKTADPSQGRALFQQICGLCHTLYGEGAKIGPELTGSDRHNLDYLLENILNPGAVVAENYRMWTITMKDDRVLNGIMLAKNDDTITLQTISEKQVLPRNEIQTMSESQVSMMPEGLLQALSDQQASNLISYLMSSGQVPPPPAAPGVK